MAPGSALREAIALRAAGDPDGVLDELFRGRSPALFLALGRASGAIATTRSHRRRDYKAVSEKVRDIFAEHTSIIEPSLDEAYLENLQNILPSAPRPPITTTAGTAQRIAHSMWRTKAAQIYRKTGNLRVVQLILCHTKLESTARYLGIEVDDALNMAEQIEL
jgi:nucleotidyltransferase/DNA polymerase involved in DNA repair